jgi:hypothetical protein
MSFREVPGRCDGAYTSISPPTVGRPAAVCTYVMHSAAGLAARAGSAALSMIPPPADDVRRARRGPPRDRTPPFPSPAKTSLVRPRHPPALASLGRSPTRAAGAAAPAAASRSLRADQRSPPERMIARQRGSAAEPNHGTDSPANRTSFDLTVGRAVFGAECFCAARPKHLGVERHTGSSLGLNRPGTASLPGTRSATSTIRTRLLFGDRRRRRFGGTSSRTWRTPPPDRASRAARRRGAVVPARTRDRSRTRLRRMPTARMAEGPSPVPTNTCSVQAGQ